MKHGARRNRVAAAIAVAALSGAALAWGLGQGAAGAASATYLLPWQSGDQNRHAVLQGVYHPDGFSGCASGCATHRNQGMHYAFDFDLPEGTPVLAARAGTARLVQGSWSPDHCGVLPESADDAAAAVMDPLIGNQANFVLLDHGDGTSALYLHLSSVDPEIERKARSGDTVAQGELLGRSGRTGLTGCRPHLHFQVQPSVHADWFTDSIPVRFVDRDVVSRSPDGGPAQGESYLSDNVRR